MSQPPIENQERPAVDVTSRAPFRRLSPIDYLLLAIVALVGFAATWTLSAKTEPFLATPIGNSWFDGDVVTIRVSMADRWNGHSRSKKHPLFSLISFVPVQAAHRLVGVDYDAAARGFAAGSAAVFLATLFLAMRLRGIRAPDGLIFTALAGTSGASWLWLTVPETFALGAASILFVFCIVGADEARAVSPLWYLLASAVSLSITITNWMAGLFAAFLRYPWRQALQISANALCLVVVLFGVQKFLIPTTEFFLGDRSVTKFVLRDESGGWLAITRAFGAHSMVLPQIEEIQPPPPSGIMLSTQNAQLYSGSRWAQAATILWWCLLAAGATEMLLYESRRRFTLLLLLVLAGQFGLHQVFGYETILYSMHFMPLMVLVAAHVSLMRTPGRLVWLTAAVALCVLLSLNNYEQFQYACEYAQRHAEL